MTIKDIARESGYAVGTVSRALNNAPGVSAETRQKILEIVNRHNYEPNANAKHLKQQTNDGIALIVKGTQNMLFAGILEPLQQIIEESGYVATVYYIDEEANEVAQARRICTERKPHGILFLGSNPEYFTPELEALGIPCLLLTNSAASLRIRNLSSVSVDDMAASDTMIEYLYKKGHRRIESSAASPIFPVQVSPVWPAVRVLCCALVCRLTWKSSMRMRGSRFPAGMRQWSIS